VNVAIFPLATGELSTYDAPTAVYCGYDGAGNLFLSGEKKVAELAKGHSDFQLFSIVGKVGNTGQIGVDPLSWRDSFCTSGGLIHSPLKVFG
jgi:hypothetical protein